MNPEFRLEILDECSSTNELLLSGRERDDFPGRALLALRQTAGRGRRGRQWCTGEGNLALSVALRGDPADAILLPFQAGLALVEVLRQLLPPEADLRLKWPNDLFLNGKKLAGLMAQGRQGADCTDLVLGIGVNLREAPEGMNAIALGEIVSPPPSPVDFAGDFLRAFGRKVHALRFPELGREWEAAARLGDGELFVLGEPEAYKGIRLLPTGELEVMDSRGSVRKFSSETVSLRYEPES